MNLRLIRIGALSLFVCFFATVWAGCSGGKTSTKSDAAELERAFGLKTGAPPSQEPTPAGAASRAVVALHGEDWPRALSLLGWIRLNPGLTMEQARAVQNAYADAYLRLSELAATGNAEAKAALERLRQEAERR